MNTGHNDQYSNRLQHSHQILPDLRLYSHHQPLSSPGDEEVELSEGGAEDAAHDAQEDGGNDSDHIHCYQVFRYELWFEESKVSLIFKSVKGRVEKVGGEGGHHAAEEDLPGEFIFPERRDLLHGEEQSAHRSSEGGSYSSCSSGRNKISSVLRISES